MHNDDDNPFILEDLVAPKGSASTKTPPKSGQKTARKKGAPFIQITAAQAHKLAGVTRVCVVAVFFHLMFRSFRSYHKPFLLPADALVEFNIDRHVQLRALKELARCGLIRVGRGGPKKPPEITIVGLAKGS